MFFFEGFIILFFAAVPLAFLLIFNRQKYSLPWYVVVLALIALLSGTIVAIGLIGIVSSGAGL